MSKIKDKNIPFDEVIEQLCNHKIIPFDKNNPKDIKLLDTLGKVANKVKQDVNKTGIRRPRPNEVGNDIEKYVKSALHFYQLKAEVPKTIKGRRKSTGYPDIEFIDQFNRTNYLECKTYNIENISTTQRSFYFSPSADYKITQDAHHFIMSFQIYVEDTINGLHIYKCSGWKILDVSGLKVDIKYEYNSDNRRMYSEELVLMSTN